MLRRTFVLLALVAMRAQAQQLPDTLRLADAIRIALANNPGYVATLNDVDLAVATRDAQWRSQFLPAPSLTLATSGSSARTSTPITTTNTQQSNTSLSLGARITVLDDGSRGNNLRLAQQTIDRAQVDHDAQTRNLTLAVITAFRAAQRAQLQIAMQERVLARSQHDADTKQKQIPLATATLTDLKSAELQVLTDQDLLDQTRSDAAINRLNLLQQLGIMGDRAVAIDTALPAVRDPGEMDVDSLVRIAESNSPGIRTSELTLRGNEGDLSFQKVRWWRPSVSTNLTFGRTQTTGHGYNSLLTPWPDNGSLRGDLTLQLGLANYFTTRNNIQRAKATITDQEYLLQQARLALQNQVRQTVIMLQRAYSGLSLAQRQAQLAADRLRTATQQYSQGAESFVNLQLFADRAANADRAVLNQRFAVLSAQTTLDNLLGNLPVR